MTLLGQIDDWDGLRSFRIDKGNLASAIASLRCACGQLPLFYFWHRQRSLDLSFVASASTPLVQKIAFVLACLLGHKSDVAVMSIACTPCLGLQIPSLLTVLADYAIPFLKITLYVTSNRGAQLSSASPNGMINRRWCTSLVTTLPSATFPRGLRTCDQLREIPFTSDSQNGSLIDARLRSPTVNLHYVPRIMHAHANYVDTFSKPEKSCVTHQRTNFNFCRNLQAMLVDAEDNHLRGPLKSTLAQLTSA